MKKFLAGILAVIMAITILPGNILEKAGVPNKVEAAVTLQDPRIVSDSSMASGQKVTYDCVWFGSYPQTEIVDTASTCGTNGKTWALSSDYEVNTSLYTSLKNASGWNSNGDVTISGIKYRRIQSTDATNVVSGSDFYNWSSSSGYHYFRYEPVKWRVLDVDGDQALLLADKCLDCLMFNTTLVATTWENSTIRSWLNGYGASSNTASIDYSSKNFISCAFSSSERNAINSSYLDNQTTGQYSSKYGGENTTDKIFFLSAYDTYNSDRAAIYGFCKDNYNADDEAKRSKASTYAKAMGAMILANETYLGYCRWLLRSPGVENDWVTYVNCTGSVARLGYNVSDKEYSVRPALSLNSSSSSSYSYAGTVCSDGTVNETKYTVSYNANGGSGAPSSQTKYYGIPLTLRSATPQKSGYTFVGWGTSSTTTTASYTPGGTYTSNASITLYAIWKKTITLTYNANGGTGAPPSVTETVYNSETTAGFSISNTIPVRSGYTFLGWGDSSTATSNLTQPGSLLLMVGGDVTLYAIWEKIASEYTVTYNANGGSGAPASQTKTEGVSLTLSTTKPTRSGYTFVGWGTSSSSTTASYSAGGTYTANASITLYAIWKKTVTLTYYANGGEDAPSAQSGTIYNSSTGYTFTISSTIPTKSGYTFLGWSTNSTATSADYTSGETIKISDNTVLNAIWKKTVTLYYDANGGSGAPSSETKTAYNYDVNPAFEISSTKPKRDGYTFLGWASNSAATSADYVSGNTISISKDSTLYAVWEKALSTYTVTYNANGGSGAPASQTKTEGVDLILSTTKPTRSGYTFAGWGNGSNTASVIYSPGGTYTEDADITLYAMWEWYITLTYNANGGSGAPSSETATVYNNTTGYQFTISSTKPTRSGYTFLGWSTSSDATSASYASNGKITVGSNTTLYAIWKEDVVKVTLTYNDANGGENYPASRIVDKGTTVNLSSLVPTKDGYNFVGWSTSKSSTSASYAPGDTIDLTSDTTLYAIWKKTITLSYDANGGSGAPSAKSATIYNTATECEITISETQPTRNGYTFLGWSTSSTATSATYSINSGITLSNDTTLYAVWEKIASVYTVTYDANGGADAPAGQTKTEKVDLTLTTAIPSRDGYSFVGWGTSSSSTSVAYNPGGIYTMDSDITLYAIWKEDQVIVEKVTLTYNDANGGENYPASRTVDKGTTVNLSSLVPTKDGYNFVGWSTSKSSTSASYAPGASVDLTSDLTLYAIWEKTITLSYDANGGTGVPSSDGKTVYNDTADYTFTIADTIPKKDGYSFVGWGLNVNAASTYGSGEQITLSQNTTLYAIWKEEQVIAEKVTLLYSNANGGENYPAARSVEKGTSVNLSGLQPTKEGYVFIGWSTNKDSASASYAPGDTVDLISDLTLYAIWKKNPDEGGGSGGDNPGGDEPGGDDPVVPDPTPQPVAKKTQTITAVNKTVPINNAAFSLGAKTSGNGKLTYKSSNTKIAAISSTGKITVKSYGICRITITAAETSTYKKAAKAITITVVPKKMKLKSVKSPKKGQLQVKWIKDKAANGYQIQFSRDWKFNAKKSKVYQKILSAKLNALKKPVTGLKSKKTYYVRIRSYKTVAGKKLYGIWSFGKVVKIK